MTSLTVNDLPHLNAALNSTATLLIIAGFIQIRRRRIAAHKACMLGATAVSAGFLVSYLIYHYFAGHTRFPGNGAARAIYLSILFTHVILAATVPFLVGLAVYRALRNQIDRHKRIVRWAFPIWLYVSITGVIVYLMLYHIYPQPSAV